MILLTAGVVSGASAQYHGGGVHYGGGFYGGRTVIVGGYSPYYGYPGLYWGWGAGVTPMLILMDMVTVSVPSKLQMQVNNIKQDYADRIKLSVQKADNTFIRQGEKATSPGFETRTG